MSPDFQRIAVIGAGKIGQEIAVQCALFGVHVTLYDIAQEPLHWAEAHFAELLGEAAAQSGLDAAAAARARQRITTTTDPQQTADVDLLSESVPERLKIKRDVLSQFHRLCPAQTVFTTNSSYFLPSALAVASGRPDRFAALHFHSPAWRANVVDVMPHRGTSPETVQRLTSFARQIGQVPIVARKENPGYVFNAMLWQFLYAAMRLAGNDVASVEDIDRAWMGVLGTSVGPFGLLDHIGLDTVRDVISSWSFMVSDPQVRKFIERLDALIASGRCGHKSGGGFYDYPQAAYLGPDFLIRPASRNPPAAAAASADEASASGASGSSAASSVADRLVLSTVPTPLHPRREPVPTFFGGVWIFGRGPTAAALEERLAGLGARVQLIDERIAAGGIAELRRAWDADPAPHLVLLSGTYSSRSARENHGHGRSFSNLSLSERSTEEAILCFEVCRCWYSLVEQAGRMDQATLVAVVSLSLREIARVRAGSSEEATPALQSPHPDPLPDGEGGLPLGAAAAAEAGAIAGLVKAIFMEGVAQGSLGPQVKVVEFAADEAPQAIAVAVCREWGAAQASVVIGSMEEARRRHADIEVGYTGQQRYVVRLRPAPLPDGRPSISRQSTWVLTGGARGITAEVAFELGCRYDVRLHLLGTTALPEEDRASWSAERLGKLKLQIMEQAYAAGQKPNVAWDRVWRAVEAQRSLARFAQAGIRATYHRCDCADRAQLAAVLDEVRRLDGPIAGIVHGAGVERTGRLTQKPDETVRATLAPKIAGTLALMELTRRDPLRYFLAFGSLIGRFGGAGQTDYAMANAALAECVQWFRHQRPDCLAIVFHWPGWDTVGMAARPESRYSLQRIKHRLMPPGEGVAHLLRELAAGCLAGEVVLVGRNELPAELMEGGT